MNRPIEPRPDRWRLVAVGLVAILVTGGVALALTRGDHQGPTTATPPSDASAQPQQRSRLLTVWPENPVRGDSLDQAQAAVDAGGAETSWRLDPEKVAQRFGLLVLGWTNVQSAPVPAAESADASDSSKIFMLRPRCDIDEEGILEGCGASGGVLTFVDQPGRTGPNGAWSVTAAIAEDMAPRSLLEGDGPTTAPPLLDVRAGSTVDFALTIPEGRQAHVGIVASDGCRELTEFLTGQHGSSATLRVPRADARGGCADVATGFVFAYAQDAKVVPVGDPLLESAPFAYPWITLIPVHVELS